MLFFKPKTRINSRNNSNKQSAKGGAIKNSTIEVSNGDATQAIILAEVLKLSATVDELKTNGTNMHKAFCLYVQNNGVKPSVKAEVKAILEL